MSSADGSTTILTIEGDASSADEAFASTQEGLASIQEMMAGIAEASASMSEQVEASFAAMGEAADAVSANFSAVSASMDAALGSTDALATSAEGAAGSLGAAGGAADAAAGSISAEGDAAAAAAAKTGGLADAQKDAAASAGKLKMPLLLAGAAVVALGAISVHMAGDFQASMTQLVTGAGESKNNLAMVSAGVLSISSQVGISAKNMAAGLYQIESAGYHGAAGLTVLKDSAEGAKVGGADMATVANAATTILNDFGAKGVTAANAVNALTATVSRGKTHLQDLAQSLAQILPTASAANVGLSDVMGAMATMTGEGVPAANAATYLRQTILALDAPSTAAKKALASVGLSSAQVATEMQQSLPGALAMITEAVGRKFPVGSAQYVAALKDIAGGSKQMQGMLDLTGEHLSTFQANVKGVASTVKAGGNSIVGWSDVQKDFNTQMAQFGVSVQNAMIAVGTALMPVIKSLTAGLKPVLEWVAGHAKVVAVGLGILAVTLGGALVAALAIASAGFLSLDASALPIIAGAALVAGGLAAIAAGAIFLYTHVGPLRAALGALGAVLGHVTGFFTHNAAAMTALKLVFAGATLGVLAFAATAIPPLLAGFAAWAIAAGAAAIATLAAAAPFIAVGAAIGGLIFVIVEVVKHWDAIRAAIGRFVSFVTSHVGAFFSWLGAGFHRAFDGALHIVQAAVTFIHNLIAGYFNLYRTIIADALHFIVGLFKWLFDHNTYFHDLVVGIQREFLLAKRIVTTIWRDITGFLTGAWQGIQHAAEAVWTFITTIIHRDLSAAQAIISAVWNGVTGFLGGVWTKIRTGAMTVWNDVIGFLGGLAGRIGGAVQANIVTPIESAVQHLISLALGWGENLIKQFIAGIGNMAGGVKNAVGNIAHNVAGFLGFHSPTKEGPGATADQWAPALMRMFAAGITANAGLVRAAALSAAHGVASGLAAGASGLPTAGAGGGGGVLGFSGSAAAMAATASAPILPASAAAAGATAGGSGSGMTGQQAAMLGAKLDVLHNDLLALARGQQSGGASGGAQAVSGGLTLNQPTFSGVTDVAALYRALNQIGGIAAENALRGATAGLAL